MTAKCGGGVGIVVTFSQIPERLKHEHKPKMTFNYSQWTLLLQSCWGVVGIDSYIRRDTGMLTRIQSMLYSIGNLELFLAKFYCYIKGGNC